HDWTCYVINELRCTTYYHIILVYFLFSFHSTSRSQCIINIRGVADKFDGEDNNKANEVVLSIVDLAGAEREKRTGNQVWLCFFFFP
ncbi:hypothetical protein PSY81_23605, partial [Shigella flexneri]|nr:hypothetical protein [Shigella flexneri]